MISFSFAHTCLSFLFKLMFVRRITFFQIHCTVNRYISIDISQDFIAGRSSTYLKLFKLSSLIFSFVTIFPFPPFTLYGIRTISVSTANTLYLLLLIWHSDNLLYLKYNSFHYYKFRNRLTLYGVVHSKIKW